MPDAFIVMQIGNAELDRICREIVFPAVKSAGLAPRRIDLHNDGGLMVAEIMTLIERSDLIIADLTNERPNCYLEVGYALGLGRSRNLLLTCRRDHLPGEPGWSDDGPKVHFDLAGFDLLLWDPDDLPAYADELERRISRRLALIGDERPSAEAGFVTPSPWYAEIRTAALERLPQCAGEGYFEIAFSLSPGSNLRVQQSRLLQAARSSMIRTFGWPIGIVLEAEEHRPRPTGDGITAEVCGTRWDDERSYDRWELRVNGSFYLLESLFEDQRGHPNELFFDTRIQRVTEALLYCGRLYDHLGVSPDRRVDFSVRHGGLSERTLAAANTARHLSGTRRCAVDQHETSTSFVLGELGAQLTDLVQETCGELFVLFDFFELGRSVYEEFVDRFVAGRAH